MPRSPQQTRDAPGASPQSSRNESPLKRKVLSLALFLILVSSLLNALFGDGGLQELVKARREYQALEEEIAALQARTQELLDEIRLLKTSPLAIERLAREQLGLVRPDEVILLIRKPQDD
ncbi:MAG: septum formation initiator family protein [Acidobacteriota bacterium]